MKYICFVAIFIIASARGGKVCTETSQCSPWECCQILSQYKVVHKRDLVDELPTDLEKTGTCEPYKPEGFNCDTVAERNGYCSCEPGTACQRKLRPFTTPPSADGKNRRSRDLAISPPGFFWDSRCVRIEE